MSQPRTIKGKGWRDGKYQVGHMHDGWSFEEILQLDKFKAAGGSRAVRREQTAKALAYYMRGQIRVYKCNWSLYPPLVKEIFDRMKVGASVKSVRAFVDETIAANAGARRVASERKIDERYNLMEEASRAWYEEQKLKIERRSQRRAEASNIRP